MTETSNQNPDSTPNSPGAILKRCREFHDISIDDAVEATKIGKNYLIALENDRVKEFSSLAYLKGFLRIYANYLGMNPDDIIRLYDKMYGEKDKVIKSDGTPVAPSRKRRFLSLQKLALPAFLLLLIVITASVINRNSPVPPPRRPPAPAAVPQQVVTPAKTAPAQLAADTTKPASEDAAQQTAPKDVSEIEPPVVLQTPQPEQPKSFIVRMKVTQNGTLTVTIDGSPPQHYELTSGDVIEWKADRRIFLELSNAGGVEAELNGKPLKSFGAAEQPASVTLDANGVRN